MKLALNVELTIDPMEDENLVAAVGRIELSPARRRCALNSKKFSRAIQPAIDPYFNECLQSLLLCLSLYKKACMNRTQKHNGFIFQS